MSGSRPVPAPDVVRDLELLLRSRYGLIHLVTAEERRAVSLLRHLAAHLGVTLFRWSRLQGLGRDGGDGGIYATTELAAAFGHIAAADHGAIYHFHGVGSEFGADAVLAEQLREAIDRLERLPGAVVITGEELGLPDALRPLVATVALPGPQRRDFDRLLRHLVRDLARRRPVEVTLSAEDRARLVNHLAGLP